MSSPCHIKICLVEKEQAFNRGGVEEPEKKKVSKKKLRSRMLPLAVPKVLCNHLFIWS